MTALKTPGYRPMTKEYHMTASRNLLVRSLSVVVALTLLLPGPAGAANVMSGRAKAIAPIGAAAAGAISPRLKDLRLAPAAALGRLAPLKSPAVSAGISESAGAAPSAQAAPQAVAAHPVIDLLNRLQGMLPETLDTPADAAKLKAAAQSLPEGPFRAQLVALAETAAAPQGGDSSVPENLRRLFDNAAQIKESVAAAPAKTSMWERLASLPLLRKSGLIKAKAEQSRPAAAPLDPKDFEFKAEQVRWVPSPETLPASTKEVALGNRKVVGQDAALKALNFGLRMTGPNYNVYVSGPDGSGRSTAVDAVVADIAPAMPEAPDLVIGTDFSDDQSPVAIVYVAPGQGKVLQAAVREFVRSVSETLPGLLNSGKLGEDKAALEMEFEAAAAQKRQAFEEKVAQIKIGKGFGFAIKMVQGQGIFVAPLWNGQPFKSQDEINAKIEAGEFTDEEWEQAAAEAKAKAQPLIREFQDIGRQIQAEYQALQEKISSLEGDTVASLMEAKAGPMLAAVAGNESAESYVQSLLEHAAANYGDFLPQEQAASPFAAPQNPLEQYEVRVRVDNAGLKGAPVIEEEDPTPERLFGENGSFVKANGGFLVLDALAVLRSGAWPFLMRATLSGKAPSHVEMPANNAAAGMMPLVLMQEKKAPAYLIPARVKVVLIGSPMLKMMIQEHDDMFASGFNANVEFESSMPADAQSVSGYVEFFKNIVNKSAGAILDLSRDAISALLEYSARLVHSNQKLSARFGAVYSLMREATFFARDAGHEELSRQDVDAALAARRDRDEGYVKHVMEYYLTDTFHVATSGKEVGQINGLAVMGNFGVPARITLSIGVGNNGGISITSTDREAGTTGPSFIKAVGNIQGFLRQTFAQNKKRSADIGISFEQQYGGLDGDSATSTQIYAILSRLSGVPISQEFAVTGSADQFGNVQPIGGANHKIEGFFALCKARGLTGNQGILVPAANFRDIQLSAEVAQAVAEGKFHIIPVANVWQGIDFLTGVSYKTIKAKAEKRLDELTAAAGR